MDPHDWIGDLITIALVVTTLIGAITVWVQAKAVFAHNEAAVRAEEWTMLTGAQRSRANLARQLERGRTWQARQDRLNGARSDAQHLLARGNPTLLAFDARQWRSHARRVERESRRLARASGAQLGEIEDEAEASFPGIDPDRGRSAPCARRPHTATISAKPGRDPPGHGGFAAVSQREAYRMEGLRSGAAQTAVRAEEQFTSYAASLAAIAVALFLFGYALTRYGHRYRRLLSLIASVLAVASLGWTAFTHFHGLEKPPAAATAAYADGRMALRNGRLDIAERDLACAARLNPGFAEAFLQLSDAVERNASPDLAVVNESLEEPGSLRRALKYGRLSRQLDSESPRALNQIALSLYVFGLRHGDRTRLARALHLDREVAASQPSNPIPAFNAGTTLLALGRPWRASYRRAESLMLESNHSRDYVGGALTDLDYLGASGIRPGIRDATEAAKEEVVTSVSELPSGSSGGHGGDGRNASLSGVRLSIAPVSARLSFASRSFDPTRDRLFVAWYRHRTRGWQELPYLSGLATSPVPASGGTWSYWMPSWASSCHQRGRYRVELYVNGRLVQVGPPPHATSHLPRSKYGFLPNMDLGICPLRGWHRISHPAAGLVDGFEAHTAAGREGVLAFDMSASPARGASEMAAAAIKHFTPPLPGKIQPVPAPSWPVLVGPSTLATARAFSYPGGGLYLATAVTPIGRKQVVAVFGPPALFTPSSRSTLSAGQSIVESILTYDEPTPGG